MSETARAWLIAANATAAAANAGLYAAYGYWWNLAVVVFILVVLLERIAVRE